LFTFKNNELFCFAGLWREFKNKEGVVISEFVIITTEPNSLIASTHDRMPTVLQLGQENEWLSGANLNLLTHPLSAVYFKETILSQPLKGV
jgi:putative SOS response-associated peptidase YedK